MDKSPNLTKVSSGNLISSLNVEIPATSRMPVLTFAVFIPIPLLSSNDVAVKIPVTTTPVFVVANFSFPL